MTVAPNYLVDGLVTSVRTKYIMPTSQTLFLDTDVVALLDEELRSEIIPLVNSVREEYWVTNLDSAITGAASYTIPQRASGGMLRDVVMVSPNGDEIDMQRLSPVQIKTTFPFGLQLPLYTFGYYLKDDQVVPYPQQAVNATAYTLRQKYLRRPNNLTLSTNCGQITVIASNVITLNSVDPTWTTGTTFDIIQNFPQFRSIADGATITNINLGSSTITLTTAPAGLAVGMYVCPALMTCVPQIPYEAYPVLVQAGIVSLATSLGDSQGQQAAEKKFQQMKTNFTKLIQERVQGGTKKITNRNNPMGLGAMGTPFVR